MILILNAGSSSLKLAVFDHMLTQAISGSVTELGAAGELVLGAHTSPVRAKNHAEALSLLLKALSDIGYPLSHFTAAAHRIVHGGADLTAPVRLTPNIIDQIAAVTPLAPLHNPHNLAGIAALQSLAPDLPQYASFDTAFHATNADVATRFAIPATHHAAGIRRYGFHGLSYANLVADFPRTLPSRLLAFHLGNGASVCAIKDGRSVATSMGYGPLSGLTMGTRAGDIDAAATLRLARTLGVDETDAMLNKQAGLLALAQETNMKTLMGCDDDQARFAIDHFCHWAARQAGSVIVAMGGVDTVAFTGGIGENAGAIRDRIMGHLQFLGDLHAHVISANEEKQIARGALGLMERGQ